MTDNKSIFDRINELYSEYQVVAGKEKAENALQSIKTSLIIETCKIYARKYLEETPDGKPESVNDQDIPVDEIIVCIAGCMKDFLSSEAKEKGNKFSQYLCTAVKNKLSEQEKESLAVRNGGITLSDDALKDLRKIKKLNEDYIKFGKNDKEKRIKEIAFSLEIPEKKVRMLLEFAENTTASIEELRGDSESALGDFIEDTKVSSAEEIAIFRVSTVETFSNTDLIFEKEKETDKPYLSALITHRFLTKLKEANFDGQTIEKLFTGRKFSDTERAKKVLESFFSAGDFIKQQEVAAWFGKDKTDASRTLRNFMEKLKRREEAVSSLKT